jgi:hypothetical protein
MQFVLLLAGVLALLVGAAAVGLGVIELRQGGSGSGLMQTGVLTSVGGFVVLGLGAVIARLQKLADLLETRPVPLNFGAPVAPALPPLPPRREVPPPVPPPAMSAPAKAPEVVAVREPPAVAPKAPRPTEPDPPPALAPEPPPVMVVSAPSGPAGQPEAAAWPTVTPSDRIAPTDPAEPDVVAEPVADAPAEAPPGAAEAPQDAAGVLKTGVIEGMAYTIYADGTVEAELPEGTIRFASVTAWREHLRPGS